MTSQAADANSGASATRAQIVMAEFAVIGMALIWGGNYSVLKYGTGVIAPIAYNGARVMIGAIALLLVAIAWGGKRPGLRDSLAVLALGALGNGVYQVFFAEGIARTRAGEAALVVGASPALMAIIGRFRGVEVVTTRKIAGIALSISGVGLVVLGAATGSAAHGSLTGDLLVLCGSVCWATYTILLIPYTKRLSGWWVLALSMTGGSLVLAATGFSAMAGVSWRALSGLTWAAILYSAFGSLVIAYILWYRGVKVLGPTRTSLYGNFQTLIALLIAWFTLGETPSLWQSVGAMTIVGGVLMTRAPATEQS